MSRSVMRLLLCALLLGGLAAADATASGPGVAARASARKARPKRKPAPKPAAELTLPAWAPALARGVAQGLCSGDALAPLIKAVEHKRLAGSGKLPDDHLEAENARYDVQIEEAKQRLVPRLDALKIDRTKLATIVYGAPLKLEAQLVDLVMAELKSACPDRLGAPPALSASETPARDALWSLLRRL